MNVAVIPARGGSKRIPGKNYKIFSGKPMIAWPIEAAKSSKIFDRIIVSTDSDEIAKISLEYGAEVPFTRPLNLSGDHIPTAPVLLHAIQWLMNQGVNAEYACCIYPTTPFIVAEDLNAGLQIVKHNRAPSAMTVTDFEFPILRALKTNEDGSLSFNWPENELTRSQDIPPFYHDAGQFYWVSVKDFCQQKRLLMPGTHPIFLPRERVLDLDTPEDWRYAELMAAVMKAEVEKNINMV